MDRRCLERLTDVAELLDNIALELSLPKLRNPETKQGRESGAEMLGNDGARA